MTNPSVRTTITRQFLEELPLNGRSFDSVEEFRIQTSSFAPQFGRSPGGQVSIISRSGTKSYHGSLFEYFRNEKMDSNDWFANLAGKAKMPLRNNDFGGTVGGPIAGKTFFFASYEGLQLRLPQVAVRTVPSIAARQGATGIAAAILNSFPVPDGQVLANGLARFNAGWSDPSSSNAGPCASTNRSGPDGLSLAGTTMRLRAPPAALRAAVAACRRSPN